MENNITTEYYGGVIKEEPLSCIESEFLKKNTCVIEAVSPYFGYYNELKTANQPKMLYFVLDGYFSLEELTRATSSIQKKVKFSIDAVTGIIALFNQTCYVIRLLNLQNYAHISMLQDLYMEQGLKFKRKSKSFSNEMGIIKLRRFFTFNKISEGLFLEQNQPNIGYFKIPNNINWEDFKILTKEVKYATDLLYFDAARAFIYEHQGIVDLVRIYKENLTKDKLIAIRERYFKLMG